MVKQTYEAAIRRVFADEGGYTNDAADPGGPTNWGITIFDARMYWKPNASAADVRAMPKSVAEQIYRDKYAAVVQYDLLPAGVDYAVLDYGINSGVGRAAKVLQRLVGAPVDGKIGLTTLSATLRNDPADLVNRMCDERMAFLRGLKTWPTFGRGWSSRVTGLRRAALGMVGKYPEPTLPSVHKVDPAPVEVNREVIEKSAKAPEEPKKTGTTETAVIGSGISLTAIVTIALDKLGDLSEGTLNALGKLAEKPYFWLAVASFAAFAFIYWKRRQAKLEAV